MSMEPTDSFKMTKLSLIVRNNAVPIEIHNCTLLSLEIIYSSQNSSIAPPKLHSYFYEFIFCYLQVVLHPTPNSPKQSELHKMTVSKGCPDNDLKIKLAIRMDKPQNMKHCG